MTRDSRASQQQQGAPFYLLTSYLGVFFYMRTYRLDEQGVEVGAAEASDLAQLPPQLHLARVRVRVRVRVRAGVRAGVAAPPG